MSNRIKRNYYISDSIKNPMQMIQSVHNEQSDKKKPVQTKVHMSANMMICGFAPDFSHSEKQSPVPSPRTHPKYPWVGECWASAWFFCPRPKNSSKCGGRTDVDRTGHQAASKQNRRTAALCTVFNI
jgi:hypothetical protein